MNALSEVKKLLPSDSDLLRLEWHHVAKSPDSKPYLQVEVRVFTGCLRTATHGANAGTCSQSRDPRS